MWLLAESTLHDFDSVAISLSPDLQIRWYGLAYLAGFLIGWVLLKWLSRTNRSLLPERSVGDLLVYAVVGVIVGGRLGYAAFYQPDLLWTFSTAFPWWELLAINRGGMASHGGMIGLAMAMLLFARRHHLPALHLFDLMSFCAPPGLFLGRMANFINGELWGKPLSESMQVQPPWWSIKYPDEVLRGTIDLNSVAPHVIGDGTLPQMTADALRRGDLPVVTEIMPQLTAFWPSQVVQAISEGPMLMGALVLAWWAPRKPGMITGVFLVVYGVLRILTETIREADEGVGLVFGLQRGQLLSVFLIVVGIVVCSWTSKRQTRQVGGLSKRPPLDE